MRKKTFTNSFIRTPLHCDVYGSFSWSANIAGRKRWILIPAGEETKLATGPSHSLPNSTSIQDLQSADVPYIEIFQNAGEIIFVPSGWYHQVWNLVNIVIRVNRALPSKITRYF